jgi:hypothetical protein
MQQNSTGGMRMSKANEIIANFQQALGKGDFGAARSLLQDDLSFRGPFETFDRPEPYLESLRKLHHIIQHIDMKKAFADGNDVCVLYDMVTNTPGYGVYCRVVPSQRRQDRRDSSSLRRSPVCGHVCEVNGRMKMAQAKSRYKRIAIRRAAELKRSVFDGTSRRPFNTFGRIANKSGVLD